MCISIFVLENKPDLCFIVLKAAGRSLCLDCSKSQGSDVRSYSWDLGTTGWLPAPAAIKVFMVAQINQILLLRAGQEKPRVYKTIKGVGCSVMELERLP